MTDNAPIGPAPGRDSGFTMVELVVSLTVMVIGIVAAIGVFNSSFAVAGQASIRSRAVALATSEIEAFRAVPYSELVVDLGTNVETQRLVGVEFTIETGVTSADEESVQAAYKQATVSVSWNDHAGPHIVVQTTLLYPGGLGPHTSAPALPVPQGGAGAAPQMPLDVTATPITAASGSDLGVDLAWTMIDESNLAGFSVRYTTGSNHVVVTESLPPGSRALRVPGLSSSTSYTFEVGSRPTSGGEILWAAAAPLTTAAAPTAVCSIGTPAIDPAQVQRRPPGQGGMLLMNPTFSVNTSGMCPGLRIVYRTTKSASIVSKPLDASAGLRTGTLEGVSRKWDSGTHLVELYDDADVVRATVTLLVCDSANACR